MKRQRRDTSPKDLGLSETYKTAKKWTDKREARATKRKPKDTTLASNWDTDNWVSFLETYLDQFEVDSDFKNQNPYKKKNMVKNFVALGVEALGSPAALVEATLNLISTWEEEDFGFYSRKPSSFHLGYISQAWDGYKNSVYKNPSLRLVAYNVSDTLSKQLRTYIGDDDPAGWVNDIQSGKRTSASGESAVSPELDQDLDNLL